MRLKLGPFEFEAGLLELVIIGAFIVLIIMLATK